MNPIIIDHVMIDLETVDNIATAGIISIGAYVFAGPMESARFYQAVDMESSIEWGLTKSESTMHWWATRDDDAQAVFHDLSKIALPEALDKFTAFLSAMTEPRIWGNGAAFDNAILANAYAKTGKKLPWRYVHDRCYRTAVAGSDTRRLQHGTHHNALDDAISQARHLLDVAPQWVR